MRDYSKVSPRFWTGDTGKLIRGLGRDCQVIAFYLFTCPSANMLGLYYLAMPTLCHETGSPLKGALKALRSLQEVKFAFYDLPSEQVYVPNMAREQIGDRLERRDNRHKAVLKELQQLRKTPFYNDFVLRYREPFELHEVQIEPISTSPSEGPSKPLRSQEQEQEQEQEQKQDQDSERNPSSEKPLDRVRVVFDHWREVWKHPRSQLDSKRNRVIRAALQSYSVDDLKLCISGYLNSPHHTGQNDRQTVYDDIELFLRDAAHIDAGIRNSEKTQSLTSDLANHNVRVLSEWTPPEIRADATSRHAEISSNDGSAGGGIRKAIVGSIG
jgi:hypothetical protein